VRTLDDLAASLGLGRLVAGTGIDKEERADPSTVRAVLDAYARGGGVPGPASTSLAAVFGTSLARIAWWMWVSLGHRDATGDEQRLGTDSLGPALTNLASRFARRADLIDVVTP
jgi:hypothetical protein